MRKEAVLVLVCGTSLLLAQNTRTLRPTRSAEARPVTNTEGPTLTNADLGDAPLPGTISTEVSEVRLVFTVLNRHGRTVPGVARDEITVTDAGRPISTFTSFVASSDLPLRLGLLVDSSDSMRRGFEGEKQAAAEFLARVLRPGLDVGFVLGFSATGVRGTTDAGTPALLSLVREFQADGQTSLYDSLCAACDDELISSEEKFPVRRVIILLSDGEDTQSRHNLPDAIAWAQRAAVAVYAISVHSSRYEYPGDRVLKELAMSTGGRAFILSNYEQVTAVFAQIEQEIRSQYVVTYRRSLAPPQSGFHPVQVAVRSHKGFKVNCRRGYFAHK